MLLWWIILVTNLVNAVRHYPNEVVDTPYVTCEPDGIVVKIRTSTANPSAIYAEDFHYSPNCFVKNENTILLKHGECGMSNEKMENPSGIMYRICIAVQIHPLFVTDSDRSYCVQCVYVDNSVVENLEQNIDISEIPPSELEPQFDEISTPQCSYSIRKSSYSGPEIHAAVVGETVYHVWSCNNENIGILVQNCHVEDLQGNKILIIDQNGCGVDQYLFKTPKYSDDIQTAFLESNVFKFVDKSMTRFRCQIRLCVKNRGPGCEQITPPTICPNIDEQDSPNAIQDISDRPKTDVVPVDPISPPPQAITVGTPPFHRGRQVTAAEPTFSRAYGLSNAKAILPNQQKAAEEDVEKQSRERRSTMITGRGSILLNRPRRAIEVSPKTREFELPELNVVGLIRVLDNPEDLDYFDKREHKSEAKDWTADEGSEKRKCLPTRLYWSLIGAVFFSFGALLVAVTVIGIRQRVLLNQNQVYAKRWFQ